MNVLFLRSVSAVGLSLLLSACFGGGGDDSGTRLVDPETVRSLIGGEPLDVDGDAIVERLNALNDSADSMVASDYRVFIEDLSIIEDLLLDDDDRDIRATPSCRGRTCTWRARVLGRDWRPRIDFSNDAFDFRSDDDHQAVARHRGVSLVQGSTRLGGGGDSVVTRSYGGWLDHGYFMLLRGTIEVGDAKVDTFVSFSIGDAAGTNPAASGGSGTWTGVMVGADVSDTDARGHVIQGDARLRIDDFSDPGLDVDFTNVHDLDAGSARKDMGWRNLSVSGGAFTSGSGENRIQGEFYGPDHENVGGVFERDRILGAFGAARGE